MTSTYRPVSIITRTVPGHAEPRYFVVEADGTTMPLNRDGYSRRIGAVRAMGRAYDVRVQWDGTCNIALSNRRIEPRDETFVCRMVDHDVAVEQRARSARLDARVAADAEAGAASVARADAAVAAASEPASPGLSDVASDIYHMLVANRDGGTYERQDGSVWACTYLDNARPAGMSAHAYAGHLSALERVGLYRSIGDDAFGDVKLPATAVVAPAPAKPLPCHLIPTPSGRFAFVGRVPADLAFAASNPDFVTLALQCGPGLAETVAKREGGAFRKLSWATEADAYAYAAGLGYAVPVTAEDRARDARNGVQVDAAERTAAMVREASGEPAMVPQPVQQQQARDMRATATPDVSSRYGAPMGRRSATMPNLDPAEKIQLSRIRLDSGGYDAGGAYWGHGAPLWCAMDHTGETAFFRARDCEAAKAHVRDEHDTPEQVRFYR